MNGRSWTVEEIRALGVRTDLETAASVWGIGRTRAYELARTGEFPSSLIRIGARYVALVSPMLEALGIEPAPAPVPAPTLRAVGEVLTMRLVPDSPGDPPGDPPANASA